LDPPCLTSRRFSLKSIGGGASIHQPATILFPTPPSRVCPSFPSICITLAVLTHPFSCSCLCDRTATPSTRSVPRSGPGREDENGRARR
ncbi:hypothetical protein B0H17DRAFT_1111181, partial [Mycena rosella]